MRLLHVCDSVIGGTGSYLAELLPLQAERYGKRAITLLVPLQHQKHLEPRLLDAVGHLVFFDRPNRALGMVRLAGAYRKVLTERRPSLVHAHSFGAGFVTRVQPRHGARLVFCPHGWAFDMQIGQSAKRVLVAVERFLAARADTIALISHHEETLALDAGISAGKLRVIPNGIAAAMPTTAAAAWSDKRLKLLFVGRFDRQKGLDTLMEAIAPLGEDVTLRTIGGYAVQTGQHGNRPLPNLAHAEHLGWLPRADVSAQMAACDLLVVPSRWEGFGLVAVEAMRQGKPVMASDVGGLRELIGGGRFGFAVTPDDPAAWRRAIMGLTAAEMALRAAAGTENFSRCYTADRMARQLDELYHDLRPPKR